MYFDEEFGVNWCYLVYFLCSTSAAVSYTHLDVYKRQHTHTHTHTHTQFGKLLFRVGNIKQARNTNILIKRLLLQK